RGPQEIPCSSLRALCYTRLCSLSTMSLPHRSCSPWPVYYTGRWLDEKQQPELYPHNQSPLQCKREAKISLCALCLRGERKVARKKTSGRSWAPIFRFWFFL